MSDKSRRRKPRNSGDSEKLSEDSYEDNDIVKGSEEEGELNASTEGTRESEYETVEESESDESTAVDDDDESVIIEYEREEGDGQESIPTKEKKLDDDEDRRNPQYIPKRGTFYEHDDRTATEDVSGGETNEKEAADRATKEGQGASDSKAKKVWREHENRWSHDRFNPDEQAPKSRDELIAIYGYDIRNEEGPPRARRRRRYGRGPNKYTRNWEDEDAYSKQQAAAPSPRGGRRGGRRGGANQTRNVNVDQEDFPPLINNNNENNGNAPEPSLPNQGLSYSNRTISGKKQREDRNNIKKPQRDAFPPLDTNAPQTNIGNHESSNRTQSNTNNALNNREDSAGNLNSAPGRRILRDSRDVQFMDSGARSIRGRGRGRGRGGSSGVEMITSISVKGRGGRRSSSNSRLPQDSVQHLNHDDDIESSQNQQHSNMPSNYQVTNKSLQDEGTREYHRRGNKNSVPPQHSLQQPPPPPPQQQHLQSQQPQSGVSGSDRRQQVVVPPRMQHQQQHQQDNSGNNRPPKRYSSLRQRSLPESGTTYSQAPPNAYFQAAGDLETSDNGNNRPKRYSTIRPCSGAVYQQADAASPYFQPAGYVTPQPVYGDTPQHPQSAGTPPLQLLTPHGPGPAYAAPFPSPSTGFVGPPPPRMLPPGAGAPPTFIPAPAPGAPIINYVATPPAYTTYPAYPAVPTAGPPTELYQPQGGITYYNTEEQNIVPRPVTQKRQRSAIPIVPPPERVPRGRGRTNREETSPPGDLGGAGDAPSAPVSASVTNSDTSAISTLVPETTVIPDTSPSPPPPPPESDQTSPPDSQFEDIIITPSSSALPAPAPTAAAEVA